MDALELTLVTGLVSLLGIAYVTQMTLHRKGSLVALPLVAVAGGVLATASQAGGRPNAPVSQAIFVAGLICVVASSFFELARSQRR